MRKSLSILIMLILLISGIQLFFPQIFVNTARADGFSGSLILRPTGEGIDTAWVAKSGGTHYTEVDETGANDGATSEVHLVGPDTVGKIDSWTVENPGFMGNLIIDNVTMHVIEAGTSLVHNQYQNSMIVKSSSSLYTFSGWFDVSDVYPSNWGEYIHVFTQIYTEGGYRDWTWDDVNSLQMGVQCLLSDEGSVIYCSQAWVEVNYHRVLISDESPVNESTNVFITQSTVSVDIYSDGLFNWTIGGDNVTSNSVIDDVTGTKTANIIGPLDFGTQYDWWINVSIGTDYTNQSYYFRTRSPQSNPLILRPNADFSSGWMQWQYNLYSDHFQNINETVADGDTSKVYTTRTDGSNIYDFYYLESPGTQPTAVTDVTISAVVKVSANWGASDHIEIIKPNNAWVEIFPTTTYATYTIDAGYYDWSSISSIGLVAMIGTAGHYVNVTQMYASVYYETVLFSDENPSDTSTDVPVTLPIVSVNISSPNLINWTIGGDNIEINSSSDDGPGIKQANIIGPLGFGTEYTWWVNASVGTYYGNTSYSFTTEAPFTIENQVPGDEGTDCQINLATVSIDIVSSALINWTIGGENITTNSSIDDTEGTKQANVIGPLSYMTEYVWWVNVSVGSYYENHSYTFTTEFLPSFFIDDYSIIGRQNGRVLATAPNGTLYCVYIKYTETTDLYIASSMDDGVTWTSTVLAQGFEEDSSFENPCIAIDSQGNISVFWQGDYEQYGDLQIRYILYRNGSWGPVSNMTYNTDYNEEPSIAYNSIDILHIVWSVEGDVYTDVRYSSFNGTEFSVPINLSSEEYAYEASIAVDGLNHLHVVWYNDDSGSIEYSMYDGIEWSTPTEFLDYYDPYIAIDKENVVHIICDAWNEDLDVGAIYYISYDGVSWDGPTAIFNSSYDTYAASISIDGNDVVHILFKDLIFGESTAILKHMSKTGSTWSDANAIGFMNLNFFDLDEVNAILLFATYPNISGVQPNIKDTGYSLVYFDGAPGDTLFYFTYPSFNYLSISDITASPNPQLQGNDVYLQCHVVTNGNLNLVKINISGPEGFSKINVSMTDDGGGWFNYDINYDIPGNYTYFIWANDTDGNSERSINYTFVITPIVYTYFYVDTSYDEETPGWGVTHFATIQSAVDETGDYSFIYVDGDGCVYNENVYIATSHIILFGNYTTIKPSVAGQDEYRSTFEVMDDYVNITGFNIDNTVGKANNYHGISIGKTQYDLENYYNVSISNCFITEANDGILSRGGYNTFANCEIAANVITGIWCLGGNNIINNNSIHDCQIGIDLYASGSNTVTNNNIASNTVLGLKIETVSNDNIIRRNNFTSNAGYGVRIYAGCNGNWVYNNNFVDNGGGGAQANDAATNHWNMSYPVCGNYWDDHDITDDYSGVLQNEPGSDGIVDEGGTFDPYFIAGGSGEDWYPFVGLFNGSHPFVAFFEPGPTNNTLRINVYAIYLNCTVANTMAQPMDVSYYWGNGTLIGTLHDVVSGTEADFYLPDYWHRDVVVGGTPYELYWLVHNTTYYWYINMTYDETTLHSETWNFHTSRAWDLNANGNVNYLDVSLFVSHYGLRVIPPGEYSWDINEDTYTNYLDVSLLVSHYGEIY